MTPLLTGVFASQISGHLSVPDSGVMFPIAMVKTDSTGTNIIDFTSIPSTYTHLQLRGTYTGQTGGTIRLRVGNGSIDTGSNYAGHQVSGNGSSASNWTYAPDNDSAYLLLESQQDYQWTFVSDFVDYSNISKHKTIRQLVGGENNGSGFAGFGSALWRSNNAITNIRVYTQGGNFVNSTFALYGIKGSV
jgi:hypothetical protein